MKTVWRVFAYLKRYPSLAAGTLSCAIVGTLMVIVFPAVTKRIIDDVVRLHHPEKLLPLILFAVIAFFQREAGAARACSISASDCWRVGLHPHRAPALSAATPRRLGDERAFA